jgi:hypothetical protein
MRSTAEAGSTGIYSDLRAPVKLWRVHRSWAWGLTTYIACVVFDLRQYLEVKAGACLYMCGNSSRLRR